MAGPGDVTATIPSDSRRLVEELFREFGGTVSGGTIRACLVQAIADLDGSISRESLPEMAVRLARIRLAARSDPHDE